MNGKDVTYALDFRAARHSSEPHPPSGPITEHAIPRIARLMALAIRFDGLLRVEEFRDYAELARLGHVTRARMTQIRKLLHLAPDIQEQILFLSNVRGLNERNLRPLVCRVDWNEQRRMFQKITGGLVTAGKLAYRSRSPIRRRAGAPKSF